MNSHSKNTSRGRPRRVSDEEIINAALALVFTQGHPELTFARLAGTVGLSPASLAHRFGSRDRLVRRLSQAITEEMIGRCERANDDPPGSVAELLASFCPPEVTPATIMHQFAFLQLELSDPELRSGVQCRSRYLLNVVADLLGHELNRSAEETMLLARLIEQQLVGTQLCWSMEPVGALRDRVFENIDFLVHRVGG